METSNRPGQPAHRSSHYTDSWLESFYWITFIMSWFGLPLTLVFVGVKYPPEYTALLTLAVQIALVGAVFFPLSAIISSRRGKYLKPIEWTNVYGSLAVAIVFGAWLGENAYADTMIVIGVAAAVLAGVVTILRDPRPTKA